MNHILYKSLYIENLDLAVCTSCGISQSISSTKFFLVFFRFPFPKSTSYADNSAASVSKHSHSFFADFLLLSDGQRMSYYHLYKLFYVNFTRPISVLINIF